MDIQIKINNKIQSIEKDFDFLFEINEYKEALFSYSSINKDSYMLIDTFSENKKKIVPNEEIYLNRSLNNIKEDLSLPAGKYSIIYSDGEKQYNFKYLVKPSAITEDDLKNIKYHLEFFSQGITEDILAIKRLGSEVKSLDINELLKLNNFLNETNRLKKILHNILTNPITELQKEYHTQNYIQKIDSKICNYLCKNGINIYQEKRNNIFLNKRVIEKKDISENIWLIQTLKEMKSFFYSFLIKFQVESEKIKVQISITNNNKKNLEKKIKQLSEVNIGDLNLKLEKNKLFNLIDLLKVLSKNEELINLYIKKILLFLNIIDTFIKEFNIKDNIHKKNITLKALNNPNYFYINTLRIKNFNKNLKLENNKYIFQNKQTFELYEYFCFLLIVDILEKLNFKLNLNNNFINGFKNKITPNETYFLLNKNGYYIKLAYDKEIESIVNGIGFRGNTTHNKPDFLLSLYDKNNNLVKCIIIEVKCCLSKHLYSKEFITKQYEQISSYTYYQYHFYDKIDRNIIKKVIVLYPTQKKLIPQNISELEQFIDIKPSLNIEESNGYFNLKSELTSFLNTYMTLIK